ncbi:MAG: Asp-tRNA(Asn)/Glu-tRNA(Gln) amidotransferase subunit GatC [Patescibacteria group bacterium]|nr:Asp-tRNA(Asn)/Glu-tRNA(Gln) amidotransferase subunit GatC [Patescibacteria group bacterium]
MAISNKQVEHIAYLARLKLNEKEKKKFSKELSQILDFIEKLKEAETSQIEPFSSDLKNVFRKDEIKGQKSEDLLEQVPEKEGNFIKTKPIF